MANNNMNGNYNLNQSNYTTITETQHTNALESIKVRRAKMVYEMELEEYNKQADLKAENNLRAWADSKDF
jgi:hypothetical protein